LSEFGLFPEFVGSWRRLAASLQTPETNTMRYVTDIDRPMNSWWWFFAGSLAGVLAALAGMALLHGPPQATTAAPAAVHPGMGAPAREPNPWK